MASPEDFASGMRALGDQVVRGATRIKREVAIGALTNVILSTPVDEGTARLNWLVGIGLARGETLLPSGDTSGQEAIAAGREVLAPEIIDGDIHLTNNLSYITSLNEGTSPQAPAGFVEEAVELARKSLDPMRILG